MSKNPDALLDALVAAAKLDAEDMIDVAGSVRWIDQKGCSADHFHFVRAVAMLDLWTEWPDDRILGFLNGMPVEFWQRSEHDLDAVRETPIYAEVKQRLVEARDKVATRRSGQEWVDDLTDPAFRQTQRMMTRARSSKARAIAANAILDRSMPKVTRGLPGQGAGVVVMLPKAVGEQIDRGLKHAKRMKEISAAVIELEPETEG